jgi:transposase
MVVLPMKAYSIDLRQKIIDASENELLSQRQIAKRFRVATSFVTKLLKQYRDTGQLEPKPRPGRPRKLNETHVQFIQDRVEAKNDITLGELCTELQQQFEITVSEPTLCRVMQRLTLTRKKKALHPSDKGSDRVQQLRTQYWETLRDVRVQDLVFIDESGVNLGLMRLFAWTFRGRRARGEKAKRGKNVSLIAGLSLKGVVGSACVLGACDGLTFEAFIATRLVPNLWPGAWVILDNCSIHLGEEVRHLIEAAGAHLVYLPPYSPDFSPIENFWSKVKSLLKTMGARSYQALLEAIEIAFNEVSETDIRNWFAHCCYCSS